MQAEYGTKKRYGWRSRVEKTRKNRGFLKRPREREKKEKNREGKGYAQKGGGGERSPYTEIVDH